MIAISGGHYPAKRGASDGAGFSEYPETMLWAKTIVDAINITNPGMAVLVPTGTLGEKVRFINRLEGVKIAAEIHFNAAPTNRPVRGSETLYCPGSKTGKYIAEKVQDTLGSLLPPSRGIKEGWYQMDPSKGIDYFLKATKCPAVILEPEFVVNKEAILLFRVPVCKSLARIFVRLVLH